MTEEEVLIAQLREALDGVGYKGGKISAWINERGNWEVRVDG